MLRSKPRILAAAVLFSLFLLATILGCRGAQNPNPTPTPTPPPKPANPDVILASTTSTGDSGLLDVLLPLFEQKTGYKVKPIFVGSGQAMTMGERGEADVLLVHAPNSEKQFMANGHGADRRLVMHNDFIVLGPTEDPSRKGR